MGRFSIRTLMASLVVSAVGLAALRNANDLWAGMMFLTALAVVGVRDRLHRGAGAAHQGSRSSAAIPRPLRLAGDAAGSGTVYLHNDGAPGPGVGAGQQGAARPGPELERFTGKKLDRHRCLHVLHLANEVVPVIDGRVAQEWVTQRLQNSLAGNDSTSFVSQPHFQWRQVRCVGRRERFLDLEEQGVLIAVAEQQHEVGAHSHASHADHPVSHVRH